jgi:cytochrome c-type biogenesis protein CcmE
MNPHRKRRIRLAISLTAAVVLAGALVYTSFGAASEARSPSQLRDAAAGRTYALTGRVVPGYHRVGDVLVFRVRDRTGASGVSVPVRYAGAVPDPFRAGREVIVRVRRQGAAFVGEKDSLVTKCPSKFSDGTTPTPAPAAAQGR